MASNVVSKVICLFADGTGNAFSTQESNVWRLYDALDKTRLGQISFYIPGVGTSDFRPWAIIDGATGLGVPSNVRRLYEFLCWNYQPGDAIHMFGFSRGAFTIRALIGMIESEGLLSRKGPQGIVSRREMRRNIMNAWRSYRNARKRSLRQEAPTIKITRLVRDIYLGLSQRLLGQESYAEVRKRSNPKLEIAFVGLFDTVEAYGVPVEEMRDAIDWSIWPIKFYDRKLSHKVQRARHALSLDDERQTFHPVRFDVTDEPGSTRIKEVWFAGVHSDVGGGYPDGALSLVPLNWMLEEIGMALAFEPDWKESVKNGMSALAGAHDSRSGFGVFYRYAPRPIGTGVDVAGPPIVHHSVVEKIAFSDELYAPHSLPAVSQVLLPDGTCRQIAGFQPRAFRASQRVSILSSELRNATTQQVAQKAIDLIGVPDPAFVEFVNDGVWLRRKAYFVFLLSCLFVVSLPWTSGPIAQWTGVSNRAEIDLSGRVARVNGAFFAFMQELAVAAGGIVPGYLQPWVDAIVRQPLVSGGAILLAAALLYVNGRLRDRIGDDARCAWFARMENQVPRGSLALWCARQLRHGNQLRTRDHLLYWPVFGLTLVTIAVGSLLFLNRVGLSFKSGFGNMCYWDRTQLPQQATPGVPADAQGFKTSDPCWDTGFYVQKGFTYELAIEMMEPFLDGPKVVDIAGFQDSSLRHLLAAPLKRWWNEAYFQPIGRIGQTGDVEWPIRSADGFKPLELDDQAKLSEGSPSDVCEPSSAPSEVLKKKQQDLGIRTRFKSRFTAQDSGEFFLYVNDAMFAHDFFAWMALVPGHDCFYTNNSGTARITITLLPEN